MAEIIENTRIGSEQASQFLPKQRFNIPKSTTQKVKSTITSLNSGLVSSNNFAGSAGTPYTFVLNPNNQTVFDLSQCYFNISGSLRVPPNYKGAIDTRWIKLGNLFVSSLFQQATLSIGGSVVALNANPGVDANMQAALKFDAFDLQNMSLSNREFLLNNLELDYSVAEMAPIFAAEDFTIYNVVEDGVKSDKSAVGQSNVLYPQYAGMTFIYSNSTTPLAFSTNCSAYNLSIIFDDSGNANVIINSGNVGNLGATGQKSSAINPAGTTVEELKKFKILGFEDKFNNQFQEVIPPYIASSGTLIPFRCKLYLSDLFNYTVDSLDYIFNREIAITLQRTSTNFIIANIAGSSSTLETKIDVVGVDKFELIAFSYVLTDDARKELLQFYSKPVQTLYGVQTTNLTPLYNFNGDSEQNITLPLTVTYDTKAILLAFPKCSNSWTTLSTGFNQTLYKQITGDERLANNGYQLSWYGSAANSYNFAGLKYIRISNTSNSNIYTYDFNATSEKYMGPVSLLKSFDTTNGPKTADVNILDYREAYSQMKQLRLLFGKDPDNALSYYDYLKDYVIIPIDLTGSNLPPNTRIFVTFQFASFGADYNPLHYGNDSKSKQLTTNLLAVFLGSDVLEYRPDGTCVVKHVLQAAPKETEVQLK